MRSAVRAGASLLMKALIQAWRYGISPVIGPRCRFHPSCSDYGLQALSLHGPWRGGALAVKRVCRCHPWGAGGFDPVPEVTSEATIEPTPKASSKPITGAVTDPSPQTSPGHPPER